MKAGTAHIEGASFTSKLKSIGTLSQEGSAFISIARSFLPQGMSLNWNVNSDDFPADATRILQVEDLDITFKDLIKFGGLFDLQEHLKAREGTKEICERLFYCPPVSWRL